MPNRCVVGGGGNTPNLKEGIHLPFILFRSATGEKKKKEAVRQAVQWNGQVGTNNSAICSKHFTAFCEDVLLLCRVRISQSFQGFRETILGLQAIPELSWLSELMHSVAQNCQGKSKSGAQHKSKSTHGKSKSSAHGKTKFTPGKSKSAKANPALRTKAKWSTHGKSKSVTHGKSKFTPGKSKSLTFSLTAKANRSRPPEAFSLTAKENPAIMAKAHSLTAKANRKSKSTTVFQQYFYRAAFFIRSFAEYFMVSAVVNFQYKNIIDQKKPVNTIFIRNF